MKDKSNMTNAEKTGYIKPKIDVIQFSTYDIITISDGNNQYDDLGLDNFPELE